MELKNKATALWKLIIAQPASKYTLFLTGFLLLSLREGGMDQM